MKVSKRAPEIAQCDSCGLATCAWGWVGVELWEPREYIWLMGWGSESGVRDESRERALAVLPACVRLTQLLNVVRDAKVLSTRTRQAPAARGCCSTCSTSTIIQQVSGASPALRICKARAQAQPELEQVLTAVSRCTYRLDAPTAYGTHLQLRAPDADDATAAWLAPTALHVLADEQRRCI